MKIVFGKMYALIGALFLSRSISVIRGRIVFKTAHTSNSLRNRAVIMSNAFDAGQTPQAVLLIISHIGWSPFFVIMAVPEDILTSDNRLRLTNGLECLSVIQFTPKWKLCGIYSDCYFDLFQFFFHSVTPIEASNGAIYNRGLNSWHLAYVQHASSLELE
jgi:hypothetical protein